MIRAICDSSSVYVAELNWTDTAGGVPVEVAVGVAVFVAVFVAVGLLVGVFVFVAVAVGVFDAVGVNVGVKVGVPVPPLTVMLPFVVNAGGSPSFHINPGWNPLPGSV